jgi:hypothetical protein
MSCVMGVALIIALSLIRLRANFRGVPLDFSSRQLNTFENVDKEGDNYYGSEVRIRFVKQKNGKLFNCVR